MSAGETSAGVAEPAGDERPRGAWRQRLTAGRGFALRREHIALGFVLLLSAALEGHRISHNGYGNNYYSAAVKSMLGSLHNFFFVSSDPGGLISVDKPPLGLWLQVLSAKLLGFHAVSVLLPEAACGFLSVAFTYFIVAPRFGRWTGVGAAAALAVFPAFVASTRDNNLDALLILLMLIAGWATVRAIETDRLRTLLLAALVAGLAFNTKALAAYLIVPGMGIAYLACAEGPIRRRVVRTALATVVLAAVSLVWIVAVDLVPQDQRPYVGGTMNDSELTLTFGYNGFGRVAGEVGGSGTSFSSGVLGNSAAHPAPDTSAVLGPRVESLECKGTKLAIGTPDTDVGILEGTTCVTVIPSTYGQPPATTTTPTPTAPIVLRHYSPVALGPPPGLLRLFGTGFGDQAAWLLPFALFGLIALAIVFFRGPRRDRRLAPLLVFGTWFVVEAVVLSSSNGIVHPYYTSALGPGTAIVAACGATAFVALARRHRRYLVLPVGALATTAGVQIYLLSRQYDYLKWLWPILILAVVACVALLWLRPRLTAAAIAVGLLALLVVPALYSKTVWEVPVDGTFPAAGPYADAGQGGIGASAPTLPILAKLFHYVDPRAPDARWVLLTQASITAAPMILLGYRAAALGGYGTQTPAVTPQQLARLVNRGEARYMLMGGAYTWRGGNSASRAIKAACTLVPPAQWRPPTYIGTPTHPIGWYPFGGQNYALYDCKGHAKQLAAD
ncbi:MAG TPA: glycosyltransferase family 39 protein [Solirubrobacteraceae bacterium]|nr:glycosyltransferase family 39 protein [Solirubrobacteraceae bacterium]